MAFDNDPPLPLQETLQLVKLPREGEVRRFMGTRAAYLPGSDFTDDEIPMLHKAAFGGHVYGQSALAVCRAWKELEDEKGAKPSERLDLHVSLYITPSLHLPLQSDSLTHPRQSTATSRASASPNAPSSTP